MMPLFQGETRKLVYLLQQYKSNAKLQIVSCTRRETQDMNKNPKNLEIALNSKILS
jgi:hypothetical protein